MSERSVVVLMGGWHSEAAVSRVSASFCSKAARLSGWDVTELELERDIAQTLTDLQPSRVFNALHGRIGEDGTIQGLLNILDLPYTHSGVLASSLAMDKIASRLIFASVGIEVPPLLPLLEDTHVTPADYTGAHVIKPRHEGSSVGVVLMDGQAPPPPRAHWPAETELIGEVYIPGRELTVSVLDGRALCVTEIVIESGFYDFDAKYKVGGSHHIIPADVPESVTARACAWAERAFTVLNCRGVMRADYRWDEGADKLYMLEVNTQPGMTATSLTPEQAAYCGISGEELVNHLLEKAQCDD